MKKNVFKLVVLVVCLLLVTSIGFGVKLKEPTPNKSKAAKEELKELGKKEAVKPKTPTVISKQDKSKSELEQDQTQVSPLSLGQAAGEQIKRQVVSSGGRKGSSSGYIQGGTLSQVSIGKGGSASFGLGAGFWRNLDVQFSPGFVCGDLNGDGFVNLPDIVYFITYLFREGNPPQCAPYTACADANGDGGVGLADVVWLINYVLKSGEPPIC